MVKKGKQKKASSARKASRRTASAKALKGPDTLHTQVHNKIQMKPVLWIISMFLIYLTIHYSLYAIKYSSNLEASALLIFLLGSLAYFTCPLSVINH